MKKKHIINLTLAIIILFIVVKFFNIKEFSYLIIENQNLHSTTESIVAFIALMISWLFFQKGKDIQGGKYSTLSMGFLAIGITRLFIAIGPPESVIDILHHMTNLFSAFFFAMVWLPTTQTYIINKKWFPWLLGAIIIIIGLRQYLISNTVLKMAGMEVNEGISLSINIAASLLFLIALLYFMIEYYRNKKSEDLIVGMVIMLFALSSILSHNSTIWSLEWWSWHLIIFVGYTIMFYYFLMDYKQTRTLLSMSMFKYKQLFENTPDGIIQIDSNADIIDCNLGESRLLGYQKDEIIGKHVTIFLSKESNEIFMKGFPILKKKGYFEAELTLVKKDGTSVSVWRTVNATYDANGKFNGAIANTHDITNRKRVENKILKMNERLEKKVILRTKDLEGKVQSLNDSQNAMLFMIEDLNDTSRLLNLERDKLNAANKELESFSYSVSHDLRAPLRAIDGFTRILVDDYASKLDKEGKRIGSVIQENTNKMGQLIDDLLSFSRMGRSSMSYSKIDMKNMANAIYHEATADVDRTRIDFVLNDLPAINGDTNMMRHVWMNLITNAVKFSSKRKKAIISVSSKEEKDKIIYIVKDNGAGFNMKYIDKIYGVFNRLHSEKDFEGTGVGLALAQRIIHRHGGNIWAEGKVAKGATLYFSLPKKGGN